MSLVLVIVVSGSFSTFIVNLLKNMRKMMT